VAQPQIPSSTTIEVTGIRASLESALNAKREDRGIVDVIKAEDIAKFPDTNLAESLQRIPGVVIDRDAGEGRNITVRGLGLDFTRVRINGIEALATTGGTDSSGGANRSRGFDFNVFASELFNSDHGAQERLGRCRRRLARRHGRPAGVAPVRLQGLHRHRLAQGPLQRPVGQDRPARRLPDLSNTFADRKVGVLLSARTRKRQLFEEGFSTVRWDNGAVVGRLVRAEGVAANNPANSTATTCGPAAQGVARLPGTPDTIAAYDLARSAANFHPRLPRYGRLTHDQDRLGVTGSVQLRPRDGTLLSLDLLYAKLDATRQEDFLEAISSAAMPAPAASRRPAWSTPPTTPTARCSRHLQRRRHPRRVALRQADHHLHPAHADAGAGTSATLQAHAKVGRADSKFRNPVQTTTTLDALNVNGYSHRLPRQRPAAGDRLPVRRHAARRRADAGDRCRRWPAAPSPTPSPTPRPARSASARRAPTTAPTWASSTSTGKPAREVTVKGGATQEVQLRHLRVPPRQPERHDLRAARRHLGGQPDDDAERLRQGPVACRRHAHGWVIPNLNAIAAAYDIYCNCLKSGPAGGPGDFTLSSITNGNARGNNRKP
jgi:iron complex outermembrane receptor protein